MTGPPELTPRVHPPEAYRYTLPKSALVGLKRIFPADHLEVYNAMVGLGSGYVMIGRTDEGFRLLRAGVAGIKKKFGPGHVATLEAMNHLAAAHHNAGQSADAVKVLQEAVDSSQKAHGPDDRKTRFCVSNLCEVHFRWAGDLERQHRPAEAEASYREAIRLNPQYPAPRINLGLLLANRGDFAAAETVYREAAEALPNNSLVRQNRQAVERTAALAARLPGLAAGTDATASPSEAVELASLAIRPVVRRYELATRLYADAFTADRRLAAGVNGNRYNAACAALLAAAGNDPSAVIGWDEWSILQDRAFGWLSAELADLRTLAAGPRPARQKAAGVLDHWFLDPDLASVREPARRGWMPAPDRQRWERLWAEVEVLLANARPPVAPAPREAPHGR